MARICFLFNHDQLHQVAHSLPVALSLAESGEHEVLLASGSERIAAHLEEKIASLENPPKLVRLALSSRVTRLLARGLESLVPARKILLYRDNLDFFRSLDGLVVSEKTSLLLKRHYGLEGLKIVHTRHGAGDRAIGFDRRSADFDLVLVSGPKIAERLVRDAGLSRDRIRITGYPKFDMCGFNSIANPFPDPSRPTVLYAPHPSPRLSSWYTMGPAILRNLVRAGHHNVIFAPHVMLFARNWTVTISPPALSRVPSVPAELKDNPRLLVDLGSARSSDMSYVNLADVYLGDASSQVYEFLEKPRPVLHVDAHRTNWRGDPSFGHWRAGPVCTDADQIAGAVDEAIASHSEYLPVQREMLAETFSVQEQPASARAAQAISQYFNRL